MKLKLVLSSVLLFAMGCHGGDAGWGGRHDQLSDSVVRVLTIYKLIPWVSFDEAGDRDPEGVNITVYLIDGPSHKGVFGNGNLIVDMYAQEPAADGRTTRTLIKKWSFGPHDAPRSRRPTMLGWGYGLRLDWRPTEVMGKRIELIVSFERSDGRVVRSTTKHLRVPRSIHDRDESVATSYSQ